MESFCSKLQEKKRKGPWHLMQMKQSSFTNRPTVHEWCSHFNVTSDMTMRSHKIKLPLYVNSALILQAQ